MEKLTERPPMSQRDKLCLIALAGILIAMTVTYELTDGRTIRAAEVYDPENVREAEERVPLEVDTLVFYGQTPDADLLPPAEKDGSLVATPLSEVLKVSREELFWTSVPLNEECRTALQEACETYHVPVCLALGVIHAESRFDPDADNGLCYGYMGLNRNYYPSDLTPAENIQAGIAHLAGQIERYDGDIQAALRGYKDVCCKG